MKTFWPFVALLLLNFACNKDESIETGGKQPASSYYIRCKIDGADKTFNVTAVASKQDLGGGILSYTITGSATSDVNNFESFNIAIQVADSLKPGVYSETDSSSTYFVAAIYNPNTSDPAGIFATQMDETNPFQLTVNVISDSLMSGSFSGKLLKNTMDTTQVAVLVTDGDFKVKVQ